MSASGCPSWECSEGCSELVAFPGSYDPYSAEAQAAGYYIETEEIYSYLRRDITLVWIWALCELRSRHPEISPLALADMSNSNGVTPGCERGSDYCRHPEGSTHTGNDIDTAYLQTDGENNYQCICGDGTAPCWNGRADEYSDGYFCTTEENIVDAAMQGELMTLIHSTGLLRVVGIDETLVDDLSPDLPRGIAVGYGADGGWMFHHHHIHWSFN